MASFLDEYQGSGQPDEGTYLPFDTMYVPDGSGSGDANGESYSNSGFDIYSTPNLGRSRSDPVYSPATGDILLPGSGTGDANGGFDPFDILGKALDKGTSTVSRDLTLTLMGALFGLPGTAAGWALNKYGVGDNSALPPLADNGQNNYAPDPTGTVAGGDTGTAGMSPQGFEGPLGGGGGFSASNPYAPVDFGSLTGGGSGTLNFTKGADGAYGVDLFGAPSTVSRFVPDTMGIANSQAKSLFDAADLYESQASQFDLGPLVAAGKQSFDLARTRLTDARTKAIGDIKNQFARNKIAGSSLATGTLASANAEFAKQEADLAAQEAQFNAQAKLQELSARSDLMSKAAASRTQAYASQIDTILKTADLAAKDATIQAGLIDSANRLKGTLAALQQDTLKTQMSLMQQEAANIRSNLTNINVANINAETAKKQIQAQADAEAAKLRADKNQGIGNLLGAILAPSISRAGSGIADTLFGSKPSAQDYMLANLGLVGLPKATAGIFG